MRRSFPVTDPIVLPQYTSILQFLYKYIPKIEVIYHSNWYMIIACIDEATAKSIQSKLSKKGKWITEVRKGLKNKYYYIKLQFIK